MANIPFSEIFYFFCEAKRSGVLNIIDAETNETKRRILFKDGECFFVQGGTLNETLGRLLVKWGKLTPEKYKESIQIQSSTKKKTGDVLLEMGLITPQELSEAIIRQVEEKIEACFAFEDGSYSFFEAPPPKDNNLVLYPLKPERIVLNGVKNFLSLQKLDEMLSSIKSAPLKRGSNFTLRQAKFGFSPQESRFLMAIRPGSTVEAISKVSKLELQHTLQLIYVLKVTGMVGTEKELKERSEQLKALVSKSEPVAVPAGQPQLQAEEPADEEASSTFMIEGEDTEIEAEAPQEIDARSEAEKAAEEAKEKAQREKEQAERKKIIKKEIDKYYKLIRKSNFFKILGVERNEISSAQLKKAYFELAKKFHPDANPEFFQGEFKDMAEEIFTKISEAYSVLSNKKLRDDYVYSIDHKISKADLEKANRQLKAETEFAKAEILLRKGDFKGALDFIQAALKLNPDEPEYHVGLGWATFKASRGQNTAEAKGYIEKALRKNLKSALDMAHYYLGIMAKSQGDMDQMEVHFKKALEHRPDFPEVTSELRLLQRRKGKR